VLICKDAFFPSLIVYTLIYQVVSSYQFILSLLLLKHYQIKNWSKKPVLTKIRSTKKAPDGYYYRI
jgi:hypothetical protein